MKNSASRKNDYISSQSVTITTGMIISAAMRGAISAAAGYFVKPYLDRFVKWWKGEDDNVSS